MNLMLLKGILSKLVKNAEFFQAENGLQAIELYKAHSVDLIFMDVQMPELDGNDAAKTIRELETISKVHTPIIALTAGALKDERLKCLDSGMDEFLTKPVEPHHLQAILDKYVIAKL